MHDFRALADQVASDIASGKLRTGERLPPQREFAFQKNIAVSTASRVYQELLKRNLVVGEVGRGTFVRAPNLRNPWGLAEPVNMPIDLQLAISISADQVALLAPALRQRTNTAGLLGAFASTGPTGPAGASAIAADFFRREGWSPDPSAFLFAGNGRQAVSSAIIAIAKPGDRIGVEPLTYPPIIRFAEQFGIQLVPLAIDDEGIDVDALRVLHAKKPLAGIYIQPSLHNPVGMTMNAARRKALADLLIQTNIVCIEDAVFAFLSDELPLVAYAPRHVLYVDSLSKRLATGAGLGFLVTPPEFKDRAAAAMRAGSWFASSMAATLCLQWMVDGTVGDVSRLKRADMRQRQTLACEILGLADVQTDANAFHLWLKLPDHWRADTFTAAAAARGVAVTPGNAFAVTPGYSPNAVRIATSFAPLADLRQGLLILRNLLSGRPDAVEME